MEIDDAEKALYTRIWRQANGRTYIIR